MENMNTIIRSCLKSVPPFLVAEEDITNFLQFIREKLLEHVCPFLWQWHVGLGFYGEQGIKGIHFEFNIHSQHFDHVKKKDTKLRQILVNHHIATSQGKPPNLKREI